MSRTAGFSMRPSRLREVTTQESRDTMAEAEPDQRSDTGADDSDAMEEDDHGNARDHDHDHDDTFLPMATTTTQVRVGQQQTYALGNEIAYFADVYRAGKDGALFGETGLLARYYSIGQDRLDELAEIAAQDSTVGQQAQGLAAQWQLECRTWDLVQRLYLERTRPRVVQSPAHAHISDRALAALYYSNNADASESRHVLDWLRDGAPADVTLEVRGNRWFYTKEHLLHKQRMGQMKQDDGLVTALDPDAPRRQERRLAQEDDAFERRLLKQLFMLIRAGEFEQAAQLCRDTGNAWRAAALQGGVEYSTPRLDDVDEAEAMRLSLDCEGNRHKALWRRMCAALAQQQGRDTYERALYGALCGDLVSVMPVCVNWDDAVWAHYNALTQSQLEAFLQSQGRASGEGAPPITSHAQLQPSDVFQALAQSQDPVLASEARHPLRVIQARLMTNQIPALLTDLTRQLQRIQQGGGPAIDALPFVVRFVAHLVLALRAMEVPVPQVEADAVLSAYVELLASAHAASAVVLYAVALPESQAMEAVARYWRVVEDTDARRKQIMLAEQYGLDVRRVLVRTVELVFAQHLPPLPASAQVQIFHVDVSEDDLRCIRALEWLSLDARLRTDCLVRGAALFRRFLLAGHLSAAQALAERLPDTTLVFSEPDADLAEEQAQDRERRMQSAIEYTGYCTLCGGLARYEIWKKKLSERPEEINGRRDPLALRQWASEVAMHRQACVVLLKPLVEGSWCDPAQLGLSESEAAYTEMTALKTLYLPQVVLKLHGVYSARESRDLEAACALAVLVAEEHAVTMQASGKLGVYVQELGRLGLYLA